MADPNGQYKTGFAELVVKLGRVPTMRDPELLALHEEYKKAWQPAEEDANVSAAGPQSGFSRQPAPQARAIGEDARTREGQEATGGPGIITEGVGALSEPKPPTAPPGDYQRRYRAGRGPNGGVLATCVACGREWERPLRAGRPAAKCEGCR